MNMGMMRIEHGSPAR